MGRTFQIDNLAGTDKKVRSGMLFVAAILSTQQMLKREKPRDLCRSDIMKAVFDK